MFPTELNGKLLFMAWERSDDNPNSLWTSDGSAVGTTSIPGPQRINDLTKVGGTVFFDAYPSNSTELWKTDGTPAGTIPLLSLPLPPASFLQPLTGVNGTLFFRADDGTSGLELWKSDGTAAGTVRVADINPGPGSSNPYAAAAVNGTLFFSADDGTTGQELWKSDGTAGGTIQVADIFPGVNGSNPSEVTASNGLVFFAAADGTTGGYELWKTDGTAPGTSRVTVINTTMNGSQPQNLTDLNGTLLFAANDVDGPGLWRSDGTPSGTVRLLSAPASVNNGKFSDSLFSHAFAVANGRALFFVGDAPTGVALWASDGTPAGTVHLADIAPTFVTTTVPLVVGGRAFFGAGRNDTGPSSIWVTDGTPGGTAVLSTVPIRSIEEMAWVNGTLFFTGLLTDPRPTRKELWEFLASCGDHQLNPGEECDDGNTVSGDGCSADCRVEFRDVNQNLSAGQSITTDVSGSGPTVANPVTATVTTPNTGFVEIAEGPANTLPFGYTVVGITDLINAPSATAQNPLQLVFQFDSSLLTPGTSIGALQIFRNGVAVPACSGPTGQAVPSPCVSSRTQLAGHTFQVTVLTASASTWAFGINALCPATPTPGCRAPTLPHKSTVTLATSATPAADKLAWKWSAGADTPLPAFGDPTASTDYALCVYDTTGGNPKLRLRADAPAGTTCGTRPCWNAINGGFVYGSRAATPEGLLKVRLKAGVAGTAKISVSGKGTNLPALALPLNPAVTVQLHNGAGECWGAGFSTPATNGSMKFTAKSD
jgi:ELWxxDGT repeat protein/cysteine-rich repeat protein